jgi:hypothetical protein
VSSEQIPRGYLMKGVKEDFGLLPGIEKVDGNFSINNRSLQIDMNFCKETVEDCNPRMNEFSTAIFLRNSTSITYQI